MVFGLPITGFYVLALALVLWLVLEYLPIGRYLYAIGANPKAAALNGIPVRRYTIGAFVASGALTAVAGVLLASKLRIGQASVGLEYLLPALVGAFLGSTTIKPGRVNVWGTLVGVAILAIGIAGIQQFGGSFWVEPMFNGVTLLIAIGIAGYAQRRRGAPASGQRSKRRAHERSRRQLREESRMIDAIDAAGGRQRRRRWPALPMAARADAFVDEAKAVVAKAAGRADKWDGPTTGPKAVGKKTVVYVAGDMRNGGILGVAQGVEGSGRGAIGWDYRDDRRPGHGLGPARRR